MMKSLFEQSGGTYSSAGDYLLPDLIPPGEPPISLGKYALLRKQYLKQYRLILYVNLLTAGALNEHLMEVEKTVNGRMGRLIQKMATVQGVAVQMKVENQMEWVGRMNNIRACVEKIILTELIYN